MEIKSLVKKHICAMVDEIMGEAKEIWVVVYGDDTDNDCFTEITKICLSHGDAAIDFVKQNRRAQEFNNEDDEGRSDQPKYAEIYSVDKHTLAEIFISVIEGTALPNLNNDIFGNRGSAPVYFGEEAVYTGQVI